MRTTVNIDESLLSLARARAHAQHQTLGQLLELSLQSYLTRETEEPTIALPMFTRGTGMRAGIDPRSNRSMMDALDDEIFDREPRETA